MQIAYFEIIYYKVNYNLFLGNDTSKFLEKRLPVLRQNNLEVEQLAFLIFRTAVYSMNMCCIEKIPVSRWQPDTLANEFEQSETPNSVFDEKLKELEKVFGNGEDAAV